MPMYALVVAKNGPKGLHATTNGRPDFVSNGHHLNCQRVSMAMFAKEFLARQTNRSVLDKTGIAGDFDFTLDWSPDEAPTAAPADPADPLANFPSLLGALQEQLGLKLEKQRGPVEVVVVDRAEKPTEN